MTDPATDESSSAETSRRGFLGFLSAPLFLDGLDDDGDGKIIDDVLGLDKDRVGDSAALYVAKDKEDAERINPASFPAYVAVKSGPYSGLHLFTGQ